MLGRTVLWMGDSDGRRRGPEQGQEKRGEKDGETKAGWVIGEPGRAGGTMQENSQRAGRERSGRVLAKPFMLLDSDEPTGL